MFCVIKDITGLRILCGNAAICCDVNRFYCIALEEIQISRENFAWHSFKTPVVLFLWFEYLLVCFSLYSTLVEKNCVNNIRVQISTSQFTICQPIFGTCELKIMFLRIKFFLYHVFVFNFCVNEEVLYTIAEILFTSRFSHIFTLYKFSSCSLDRKLDVTKTQFIQPIVISNKQFI